MRRGDYRRYADSARRAGRREAAYGLPFAGCLLPSQVRGGSAQLAASAACTNRKLGRLLLKGRLVSSTVERWMAGDNSERNGSTSRKLEEERNGS